MAHTSAPPIPASEMRNPAFVSDSLATTPRQKCHSFEILSPLYSSGSRRPEEVIKQSRVRYIRILPEYVIVDAFGNPQGIRAESGEDGMRTIEGKSCASLPITR